MKYFILLLGVTFLVPTLHAGIQKKIAQLASDYDYQTDTDRSALVPEELWTTVQYAKSKKEQELIQAINKYATQIRIEALGPARNKFEEAQLMIMAYDHISTQEAIEKVQVWLTLQIDVLEHKTALFLSETGLDKIEHPYMESYARRAITRIEDETRQMRKFLEVHKIIKTEKSIVNGVVTHFKCKLDALVACDQQIKEKVTQFAQYHLMLQKALKATKETIAMGGWEPWQLESLENNKSAFEAEITREKARNEVYLHEIRERLIVINQ